MSFLRVSGATTRVDVHSAEIYAFARGPESALELRKAGMLLLFAMRRTAPVSDDGSHFRAPGWLRDHLYLEGGLDERSLWLEVITPAKNPENGFPYGLWYNQRKRAYMRHALLAVTKGV